MSIAPAINSPLFSYPAAPGGLLYTYAAGGTTPLATFSDALGTVPNSNPVVLDTTGSAIVRGNGAYHLLLKDSTGTTTLYDEDSLLYGVAEPTQCADTGTVNALVITNPAVSAGLIGSKCEVVIAHTNTSRTVTMAVNGNSPASVIVQGGANPQIGQLVLGQLVCFELTSGGWLATNLSAFTVDANGAVSLPATTNGTEPLLTIDGSASTPEVAIGNSGTAFTLNACASNVQSVTMTGNATMSVSNPNDGQTVNLFVKQGAGPYTLAWPASFKWAGGSAGAISTVNGAVDLVVMTYRALTGFWYASILKAFA